MDRRHFLALGLLPLTLPLAAQAQTAEPVMTPVNANGLVGELYVPAGAHKAAAVLVLGGSEGGLKGSGPTARNLARHGYVALAIAYFGLPGLPENLELVPLEYFDKALDRLLAEPAVDHRRVGVLGGSKGGEAALEIASRHKEIRAVVAGVPSHVLWQGVSQRGGADGSSWSLGGKPTDYLPYDVSRPFTGVFDLYQRSLEFVSDHPGAIIPVEKINGPILLISGQNDALWPSTAMANAVAARLKARHFRHPVTHLVMPNAGHAAFGPPIPAGSAALKFLASLGGTLEGNLAAREQGWAATLEFLRESLAR